jgi:hypothetical protein
VDTGQQCSAFPHKGHPTPEQLAGSPHVGRRDVGLREHATTAEPGNLLRVDRVVFGLTAMDGFHRQRLPEDKRHPFSGTEVGKSVPGEEAFHGHDDMVPGGCDSLEEGLWSRGHIPMDQDRAILV